MPAPGTANSGRRLIHHGHEGLTDEHSDIIISLVGDDSGGKGGCANDQINTQLGPSPSHVPQSIAASEKKRYFKEEQEE